MVHWVYVLECDGGNIYVGETTRLYRRFTEHINKRGSVNTSIHTPRKLIGLYKVADNFSFTQYRDSIIKMKEYNKFLIENWGTGEGSGNLDIENYITELYIFENDYKKVKGGKYTKQIWANPTNRLDRADYEHRPLCDCENPSEVKLSKDKKTIYFVCSLKNVWDEFNCFGIQQDGACDFYKIYDEDIYIKKKYEISIEPKLNEKWLSYIPISRYKISPEPCVKCNKTTYMPLFAHFQVRRLCQECIADKYDELYKEYTEISGKCLIIDD